MRADRPAGTPRPQLGNASPAPPLLWPRAPSPPRAWPWPWPAHVPRPRLRPRRRQAFRGEGNASSHSPARLGRKRRTSESALTTRNPSGPERGTQASHSQERPLCLKIQPAYKHTLSTRLHSAGRGKNNPSLQSRRNGHSDILLGRPPGVRGQGFNGLG